VGSPEPAMFRTCVGICSTHTRIVRICLQHMHAIQQYPCVRTRHWRDQTRQRQTPAHHSTAPYFASPGAPLRTCANQLGRCPSKNLCLLVCPGRWRGCGRPSQGPKKNPHNLFRRGSRVRYVHWVPARRYPYYSRTPLNPYP